MIRRFFVSSTMNGGLTNSELLEDQPERHHPAPSFVVEKLRVVTVKFLRAILASVFNQRFKRNVKTCGLLR